MNTIFALATSQGRSGVAVVRISGPNAFDVGTDLCGALPEPRKTGLRDLKDGQGRVLDSAMVLSFKSPASFTGEDVVELHLHGSIAVVQSVLRALSNSPYTRLAEPGEFTRRALENNKMDLPQVEGLADLIEAETESQRVQAIRVLSGDLGQKVEQWRENLIRAAALLEATIDFADEDVPVDVTPEVQLLLSNVSTELQNEVEGSFVAERIRSGFEVALVGAPNVGKSTLLNRLAGRDAAITSEIAGTTRDVIEVRMDLAGLPVTFLDTAGIHESTDTIESIGIERAVARANQADLRVFLGETDLYTKIKSSDEDIFLTPKVDLLDDGVAGISGKTGSGVSELVDRIREILKTRASGAGLATRERHRIAITSTLHCIKAAQNVLDNGPEMYDISSEELRTAIRSLEALIGRIDVENLLDEIFSSFCLGK